MKQNRYLVLLLLLAVFTQCKKDDSLPAMSRTVLKAYGPDFADIQTRLYLVGNSPVKRSGACWVLKSMALDDEKHIEFATLNDNVQEGDFKEPGICQMRITGLQSDTVYFARFFVTNDQGTFFSYPIRIKTGKKYDAFTFVEAGSFSMGNAGGALDEMPIHKVTLKHNFYISTKEVTNSEFCDFLNKTEIGPDGRKGSELWIDISSPDVLIEWKGNAFTPKKGSENKPVICITWHGAQSYCHAKGGYLPTEAEWEFAAKGGINSDGFPYSGSSDPHQVGWFSVPELNIGGMKKANSLNIYDMSGNVAEWCNDWYSDKAYEKSLENDPEGPASGTTKVIRGGSYHQNPVRITTRSSAHPNTASRHIGFRMIIKL